MADLPTGTVTFLFTDIEGSTALLRDLGDDYRRVQDDHMRLMRKAIAEGGGTELRTEGDAFFAVFPSAPGAVRAAVTAQRAFHAHRWSHGRPLRVRMGMHTGEGRLGGDDYLGIDVNRAARIAAAGHGGQVLLSEATRALVAGDLPGGVTLRDLGRHRLKDFDEPRPLHDLAIDGLPSDFPAPKTLEVPTTLPIQLTSFVGREEELANVAGLVERSRLVTLTGPGGTGKTRLAVEAAHTLGEAFPDGAHFVDLSPITDPRVVADTISAALRLRRVSGLPVMDLLVDHLRDRTELLILDNFEHVMEAADTVAAILRAAPRVHALVTSRAPLGLKGEREVPVAPLELPGPEQDPASLRQNEAVALFAERASAVEPKFSLTDDALPVVAEICARLDGLPLAIELAASRVRLLPPRSLLDHLDRRLPVLVGGPRDAPARQRTLAGAIAWSYELLDQPVRAFFRRLCVFAGGCPLDAAAEVTDPRGELGDALEMADLLLQHSLVHRDPDESELRLRMLDTIREFGLERLEESGEADDVRQRHASRFVELAEAAEPHLTGPDQDRWLDALTREHDNIRAALRWAVDGDRGDVALRLGGALWRFWYARAHLEEARRWLDAALALPSGRERNTVRVGCLTALGGIAYWQGDFEAARAAYEESLEIARDLGDRAATVLALFNLANAKAVMGDPHTAMSLLQESLALARELGDRHGEGWALWALGMVLMFGGDLDGSQIHLEESLRIFEEVGDDTWGLGNVLASLAGVRLGKGDPVQARERILVAIDTWGQQGNAIVTAGQLRFLAIVANNAGQPERAARLAGAFAALLEKAGGQIPDAFFPFPDPRESAAQMLDPETLERAWSEGRAMTLEEALTYAREGS